MPNPEQYLATMDHDDGPDKKRPRRWKRWAFVVIITLLSLFLAYMGYIISIASQVSTRPFSLSSLLTDGKDHTNILILGIGNPGHSGEKLSDTILVLSLNRKTNHVVQVSVPRDLRVRPEGYGPVKINQANALGGSELAQSTVENVLGLSIQYTVTTDFNGLKDIVDAVDGINVDVKNELRDTEYPCSDDENRSCGLDIKAGQQHMDGSLALQYARCRKGTCGNDFGRAARQQEVINLIATKVGKPSIVLHPVEIAKITTAVKDNMTTNLSGLDMFELVHTVSKAKNSTVHFVLSEDPDGLLVGANGSSDLLPRGGNYDLIQARVTELIDN
jgi:LCP family protein required for cell wall assembly